MINSSKLIPRRSSGNSLNLTATSDLNVVRGTVVKIDNILKERLVLSKVREGIIRQQEERRIRSRRETLLERDDVKNNYSVDDEDKIKKPKSGLGGLLGSVFKGILGSLGSVAFGLTPSLLGVGLLVRKLTNPFLAITGVAFATLNVVVSKSGSQFKEIERKVNKSDISESKILGGAQSVVDALIQAAFILGGGTLAGRGIRRAVGGQRFTAKQVEAQRKAADLKAKQDIFAAREARIRQIDVTEADLRIKEAEMDIDTLEELDRTGGEGVNRFRKRRKSAPGVYVPTSVTPRGKKIIKRLGGEDSLAVNLSSFKFDPNLSLEENEIRLSKFKANLLGRKRLQVASSLIDDVDDIDVVTALQTRVARAKQNRLLEPLLDEFDEQFPIDIDEEEFSQLQKELGDPDIVQPDRAKRLKSSPAMRRGMMGRQLSFDRILDRGMLRVGGKKLAKSAFGKGAKSIIRSSVSGIPLIGDLIALLLDVFVFGEPVGRAAFMAVGSIIGGIIGGVAGLVAGPVGALIGGLVGSVGGDLLGAAFYDLIFRRGGVDVGSRFGNAITRGGIKAGVSGALEAGGFANYGKYLLGEAGTEFVLDADSTAAIEDKYPGFLMALNKSDGAGAIDLIREYASYETEGRVDFIPIPIPSVTNSDPQVIVINSQPKDKRLYSQHYRRG